MRVNGVSYRTVWMEDDAVKMIDQRLLPSAFTILTLRTPEEVAGAIRDMAVRGAGAIGVAAGCGMALAALTASEKGFDRQLAEAAKRLRATRPTAWNLFYAVDRVLDGVSAVAGIETKRRRAFAIAQELADADAAAAEQIGVIGQPLLASCRAVLTHCNAGWLAFVDWGTALSPIYKAHRAGQRLSVFATETRPRSQGAKLTMWELSQEGVPCTLIPDTAAGHVMRQGLVQAVIVGADRIAANGDVANKIGTYGLAVLAKAHQIPFYVAAPTTTIDLSCPSGGAIPIEERSADEVTGMTGAGEGGGFSRIRIAPEGISARNWAFDVTPADLITALVTERGVVKPERQAIGGLCSASEALSHA